MVRPMLVVTLSLVRTTVLGKPIHLGVDFKTRTKPSVFPIELVAVAPSSCATILVMPLVLSVATVATNVFQIN
jgi:hypothetical protein